MDELEIKCTFSKNCKYKTNRSDILKRHIEEKHLNKRKQCECGILVVPSGYARHKRNACKLMKQNESTPNLQSDQTSTESLSRNSDWNDTEKTVKIEVTLHVCTTNDGHTSIRHDNIEYEGIKFILVPYIEGKST